MLFFLEVVVSDASGGLQSALEIVAVGAFLADNIIIDAFPLFQQTGPLGLVVDGEALVALLRPHEAPSFREDKHSLRIA